ncbi:hypothetical protein YC2023_016994 [Brassica napus]
MRKCLEAGKVFLYFNLEDKVEFKGEVLIRAVYSKGTTRNSLSLLILLGADFGSIRLKFPSTR